MTYDIEVSFVQNHKIRIEVNADSAEEACELAEEKVLDCKFDIYEVDDGEVIKTAIEDYRRV